MPSNDSVPVTASPAPVPFIIGCGRSGTTLLRAMLDAHPALAIPGEANFVAILAARRQRYATPSGFDAGGFVSDVCGTVWYANWGVHEDELRAALASPPAVTTFTDAVRRLYGLYARSQGKPRWGDKTPSNILQLDVLAEVLPEARFVHLVRDGRNVGLSLRDLRFASTSRQGVSLYWRRRVMAGRAARVALGPERYLEVRYEELVDAPEGVLRQVCAFVALDYDPAMLGHTDNLERILATDGSPAHFANLARPLTAGLRDWRTTMTPRDVEVFELLAGDALDAFGYERSGRTSSLKARAIASGVKLRHGLSARLRRSRRRPSADASRLRHLGPREN